MFEIIHRLFSFLFGPPKKVWVQSEDEMETHGMRIKIPVLILCDHCGDTYTASAKVKNCRCNSGR
jgi:hypothetical protein